jgi:hypothetical protein
MRPSWSFLGAKIPLARADEHIGLRLDSEVRDVHVSLRSNGPPPTQTSGPEPLPARQLCDEIVRVWQGNFARAIELGDVFRQQLPSRST